MSDRAVPGIAPVVFAAMLAALPARADVIATPACQRDLAAANHLIGAIAARDKQFVPGDLATNCRLLRQNLADMVKARPPMDRCLSGHDHGETVAQMDASIEDIRATIATNCTK
jgi:hypothetical protein